MPKCQFNPCKKEVDKIYKISINGKPMWVCKRCKALIARQGVK